MRHATRNTQHESGLWSLFTVHCALLIILLAYLAAAVLYGVTVPIFETPDANGHYAYIHELTEGRGLPVQGTASGQRVTGYVASHPPLYYSLCAALTFWVSDDVDYDDWAWENPYVAMGDPGRTVNKNRLIHPAAASSSSSSDRRIEGASAERFPWRGTPLTMHIARLVSTALCFLAVIATYSIACELFPGRRWLAVGAASLTAFNPMFVFTAARVSNDAAVAAFGSLVIWGAVRLAVKGLSRRGLALLGVALGLAALSKLSGLVLAPAVALALLLDATRNTQYAARDLFHKERLQQLLINALILFGTAFLFCGWWFVRNLLLYGELMGVDAWLSQTATVRPEPIGVLDVIPELGGLEKSYWAMFGWFNIPVASWMYRLWWVLVRLGVVGLVLVVVDQWMVHRTGPVPLGPEVRGRAGRSRTVRRFSRSTRMGLLVLVAAFVFVFGSVWRFIMIVLGAQGRYLMPVVAPISILLMLGVSRLLLSPLSSVRSLRDSQTRLRPRRGLPGLAALVGLSQLSLTLISLFVFILPAYATPRAIHETQLPRRMERFHLTFDGTPIELIGGHIEKEEAHPGGSVPLSLYWRATEAPREDLVAFVQILGRDMEPIAGVDCYPGRGNFPPTLWRPGVIYRDRYTLRLASNAEVPTVAALHAGLRAPGGERLSMRRSADQPALDLALLDLIPLRPRKPLPDEVTHPVEARLGETIRLVGYDISADGVQPGQTLTVTLVWRAEANPAGDYTVFVHLVDRSGNLVGQDDHPPLDGAYRTPFWAPGDVVRDPYHLTVDDAVAPGSCTLLVGMYNPATGQRLPAYDGLGARFEGDAVVAGGVTSKRVSE